CELARAGTRRAEPPADDGPSHPLGGYTMSESGASDPQNLKTISESKTYEMVRLLAEGGMGQVYEAKQFGAEGFEKTVAIKTILESFSTNPEFVRLFIGEAKLVADLVHENIVQVYHLGKAGNVYYIALEFVEGINLEYFIDVHLERGKLLPIELGAF